MRVHVAFTPAEAATLRSESWSTSCARPRRSRRRSRRATSASTAAARSTRRCALKETLGSAILGGERNAVRIDGFDVGASPREFLGEPRAETVIFSTTNGTRAILETAARSDHVVLGSLLNLDAVAAAARELGDDVTIVCAGFQGQFALDDAYCAGRIVQLLDAEPSDSAKAAEAIARAWPDAHEGLLARTYGPPGLEEDIAFCAQVSVLDVVPRLSRMVDGAAEITLEPGLLGNV